MNEFLSVPFCPYHFVRSHFVRIPFCQYTILSIPFCPLPFCSLPLCPYIILSIPFCSLPLCPRTVQLLLHTFDIHFLATLIPNINHPLVHPSVGPFSNRSNQPYNHPSIPSIHS